MIQPKMFAVVVIFVGCMLTQIDALTLTNEPEPFQEDSSVKITCVMPLYNGQMTWKYNSIEVARCTPDNCLATDSGEGGPFIFAFDISNKIFTWTIVTASLIHDKKLFECIRDNTDKGNFTATVKETDSQTVIKSEKRLWNGGFGLSIVDLVAWIVLLISILCFICGCCCRRCYEGLKERNEPKPPFSSQTVAVKQSTTKVDMTFTETRFEYLEKTIGELKHEVRNLKSIQTKEDQTDDDDEGPRPLPPTKSKIKIKD